MSSFNEYAVPGFRRVLSAYMDNPTMAVHSRDGILQLAAMADEIVRLLDQRGVVVMRVDSRGYRAEIGCNLFSEVDALEVQENLVLVVDILGYGAHTVIIDRVGPDIFSVKSETGDTLEC